MAEELAHYLEEKQLKVCYLHSSLKTPQRTEILQKLRLGVFDCIVGVNLLREGLDLPEVALVAVMDADIESFLRDKRSLIQIIGRAARNTASRVLFYADKITGSMQQTILETERRRAIQQQHNQEHNITPQSAQRSVVKSIIAQPIITPKKQKKITKTIILLLSYVIVAVVVWKLSTNMQATPEYQQEQAQKQITMIVEKVGKLIVLPADEVPQVAVIQDVDALKKSQDFFVDAQNGDKILVYVKARKAIIYREDTNKVVNIALNIGTDAQTDSTTAKPSATAANTGTTTATSSEE